MIKLAILAATSLALAGCANATRTVFVPTFEERTVSGERVVERAPLVVPPDYRSPTLRPPEPPRRPCSLGNTLGCDNGR